MTPFTNKRAASHRFFRAEFLRMSPLHPLASGCNGKKTRQAAPLPQRVYARVVAPEPPQQNKAKLRGNY